MRTCTTCSRVVSSNAAEGHEPKLCGLCAEAAGLCPWCGAEARRVIGKKAIGRKAVFVDECDLGWHCKDCDDYYGIDDDGKIY